MTPDMREQVALAQQMIQLRLEVQRQRVLDHWEPLALAALDGLAEDCSSLLTRALAQERAAGRDPGSALAAALAGPCARLVEERIALAQGVLLAQARQELRVALETVTKHGLLAPLPPARASDRLAEAQAAGPALAGSVRNAFAAYQERARQALAEAGPGAAGPGAAGSGAANLASSLDKAASVFSRRLGAAAVTLTHAVANRTLEAAARAV